MLIKLQLCLLVHVRLAAAVLYLVQQSNIHFVLFPNSEAETGTAQN